MADENENENETPDTTVVPAVTVAIAPPAPESDDEGEGNAEGLEQIGARIEALQSHIDTAIEGERTWTTETITSLRTELTNLRADLSQITEGYPQQITALREELTRLSLSLQAPETVETVPVETPPAIPPSEGDTLIIADAPIVSQSAAAKGKRRVV